MTTADSVAEGKATTSDSSPVLVKRRAPPPHGVMLGSSPCHFQVRDSPLSNNRIWRMNHEGLLHLGVIIFVCGNIRYFLEAVLHRAVMLRLPSIALDAVSGPEALPGLLCAPLLLGLMMLAVAIERLAAYFVASEERTYIAAMKKATGAAAEAVAVAQLASTRRFHERLVLFLISINMMVLLLAPCTIVWQSEVKPALGGIITCTTVVIWLKLITYAHCNWDERVAHRAHGLRPGERGGGPAGRAPSADSPDPSWALLRYPENVTAANMLYFVAAPTLTYQVNFPRSPAFRPWKLAKWLLDGFITSSVFFFLADNYLAPAAVGAAESIFLKMDLAHVIQRMLLMALPNVYCWLLAFFMVFHVWCNILAEVLRFGDREFYKEWWNAPDAATYWRLWNQPVHKWCLRTVYFPCIRRGVSRYWAQVATFLISAFFHEVLTAVPLRMVCGYSFVAMAGQIPLITLTRWVNEKSGSPEVGNYVWWFTFCIVGQPMAYAMYYHDYLVQSK